MRNYKLDNIRAFAILSVVFGHSIILYSSSWSLYEPAQTSIVLDYIKQVIDLYQMPLFFSLSGYLLEKKRFENSFKMFLMRKIRRLLIPFFMTGLFIMIPLKVALNCPGYRKDYWTTVIRFIIGKETGHLWYLPTLFLIFLLSYVCSRILRVICKTVLSERWCFLLLVSILIFTMCLYVLRGHIPNIGIPYQNNVIKNAWGFLLGIIICRYKLENRFGKRKIFTAILGIIAILLSVFKIIPTSLNVLVSAIIVLMIYVIIPEKKNLVMNKISKNSFGIYLFHSPLIYITFTFWIDKKPWMVVCLNFLIWGTLTFVITEIVRKTKMKFVIGE